MADDVTLSVVVPCRNMVSMLPTQLAALVAQAEGGTEIIVVDNGSTDGGREVAATFHGVRVIDATDRPGRHYACNVGARAAEGGYLVFVDADDEVAPGFLAAMREGLERADFASCRLAPWPGLEEIASLGNPSGLQDMGSMQFVPGGALGVRRAAFEAVDGFDEAMDFAEDADLSFRLARAGFAPTFVPDAVVRVRPRPTAWAMFRQHRNYGRGQVRLFVAWRHDGMERRPWREVVSEAIGILKSVPYLRDRRVRARWARRLGRLVGRLEESVRKRTLYL